MEDTLVVGECILNSSKKLSTTVFKQSADVYSTNLELLPTKLDPEHDSSPGEESLPGNKSRTSRFNICAFLRTRYQENLRRKNIKRRRQVLRSDLSDISEEEQIGSTIYVPQRHRRCCLFCPFFKRN